MSDLFGNHIVGFPSRRLIYECTLMLCDIHGDISGDIGDVLVTVHTDQ